MFGSELAYGEVPWKGRLHYMLLGHDHIGIRIRSIHLRKTLHGLSNFSPARILDAGCGEGCYSFWFAKHDKDAKIIGIDLDQNLIRNNKLIKERILRTNVSFDQKDLQNYKSSEKHDLICCMDVLEHIDDDEIALWNLRKVLSRKGYIVIHVPSLNPYKWWPFCNVVRDQADHVRDGYTTQELISKLKKVGLEVETIRYTFGRFGALSRDIFYFMNELKLLRSFLKLALFPLLISLAYLDSFMFNRNHQGMLVLCRGSG